MCSSVDPVSVDIVGEHSDGDDHIVGQLATVYAVALRLSWRGASDTEIASALGTEESAVPMLVEVAYRKLDELRRR